MVKPLNFNKTKKRYWVVTLPDEDNTTLFIYTPTKELFNELVSLNLQEVDETSNDLLDNIYDLVARLMSRNKANIKVTSKDLASCLDFDDLKVFINGYIGFISEIINEKN